MASCENLPAVSAYHDGELPPVRARQLEDHIRQCDACREELARLEALTEWLSMAPAPEIPAGALGRLRHTVLPGRDRAALRTARTLTAAAAAVLIACSVQLWRQGRAAPVRPVPVWESAAVMAAPLETESVTVSEEDVDLQLARSILGSASNGDGYGHE